MSEKWMEKHKGELLYTRGQVWRCGEDCGCSKAEVVDVYRNKVTGNSVIYASEWEGEFYSDYESGAEAELIEHRRRMRKVSPEREAKIVWEEGIDYGEMP